jgi:hypothetical protein
LVRSQDNSRLSTDKRSPQERLEYKQKRRLTDLKVTEPRQNLERFKQGSQERVYFEIRSKVTSGENLRFPKLSFLEDYRRICMDKVSLEAEKRSNAYGKDEIFYFILFNPLE